MFEEHYEQDFTKCEECGAKFDNAFDAVDHLLEDEDDFDPALILPGGYRLMVGSLLRSLFTNRNNPDYIKEIAEATYATLFMAETHPENINDVVEDIIVETEMENFDAQVNKLFKNGE